MTIVAWQQQIPLQVLPIGINYNSFILFGKNVHLNIGEPIDRSIVSNFTDGGILLNELTEPAPFNNSCKDWYMKLMLMTGSKK